jgi:hypothetical protein
VSGVAILYREAWRVNRKIEEWILRNKCKGKYINLKVMRREPAYPDEQFFYADKVGGVKLGSLGVYLEGSEYRVTFGRSGMPCGSPFPFSSEKHRREVVVPQIERFVFCVRNLARWSKIDFEHKTHNDILALIAVDEAQLYCLGEEVDCEVLLGLIGPSQEPEVAQQEQVTQEDQGSLLEWGTTIT